MRLSRQLYKGQSILHGALEETFSQELQEEQNQQSRSWETGVPQISCASFFQVSRQSGWFWISHSSNFFCSLPSFDKLSLSLSLGHIKRVLSWKSCEYSDRCQSSKAWKRGMIQSTLLSRYHPRPWLFSIVPFASWIQAVSQWCPVCIPWLNSEMTWLLRWAPWWLTWYRASPNLSYQFRNASTRTQDFASRQGMSSTKWLRAFLMTRILWGVSGESLSLMNTKS